MIPKLSYFKSLEKKLLERKGVKKFLIFTNLISLIIILAGKMRGRDYESIAVWWAVFVLKLTFLMRIAYAIVLVMVTIMNFILA